MNPTGKEYRHEKKTYHQSRLYLDKDRHLSGNKAAFRSRGFPRSGQDLRLPQVVDQLDYRFDAIEKAVAEEGCSFADIEAVIGIGGLLKNVLSGVYSVNDAMVSDLSSGRYGEHAANLGGLIARRVSDTYGIPCYIADPITVDEMQDVARISGHPLLPRYGRTHTLNHKRSP